MDKVVDNREEQRIERDASNQYPEITDRNKNIYDGQYYIKRSAYIAGATKEAQRNKEDAIGFAEWISDNAYYENGSGVWECDEDTSVVFYSLEQLYEIYINQKV